MIDIESNVFEIVASAIEAEHPGAYVSGEYTDAPARFPAVTIMEASNSVYNRMRTVNIENAVLVMYEVNVFSNRASGKKAEAKSIVKTMDEAFATLGFTRSFSNQVPNLNDSTIHRIICRYEAVVGPGESGKYIIYQN